MFLEHNEAYHMVTTDKSYKRKFLAMFVKIIPATPYKVARAMITTYNNERVINSNERALLVKWTNLTHGRESGCIEWGR